MGYTTPGTSYVGTSTPQPVFRDGMDAARSMWKSTSVDNYSFPDGYLGDVKSRRGDRLLDAVKKKLGQKSYDRGVHVGERIDRSDYFWPKGFEADSGLRRQATTGLRHAPKGNLTPVMLINDGKSKSLEPGGYAVMDPKRQSQLRNLGPSWR